MTAIEFADVGFGYRTGTPPVVPGAEVVEEHTVPALAEVCLSLPAGSATLITGPSGSGKSTALRLLNGLIPHVTDGDLTGRVVVNGLDVATTALTELGRRTATVFQNPRNQFFAATVREELAFARQQAGEPADKILGAVQTAADRVGIGSWLDRSLWTMSGGELQAVACATALAGTGTIYLFDEPTSNLSARAITALAQIMREMKHAGATLVIAEHRLYFLRDIVDTVVTMDGGRVTGVSDARDFFSSPEDVRRAAGWRTLQPPVLPAAPSTAGRPGDAVDAPTRGIELHDLRFRYGDHLVLDLQALSFPAGKVTVLAGDNGAGKSTLCRLLTGLGRPDAGTITWDGVPATEKKLRSLSSLVMQDVHRQLFAETVLGEVTTGSKQDPDVEPRQLLDDLDLAPFADRHPMSLSGGQMQRVVIASAVAASSRLVIFDEPTSGVDYRHMVGISRLIRTLAARGVVVVVVTHDLEFMAECADRVVQLAAPRPPRPSQIEIVNMERTSDVPGNV